MSRARPHRFRYPRGPEPAPVPAILLAAGEGVRLGAGVPKAFYEIAGRTLLEHALRRFVDHPLVGPVIVTAPAGFADAARAVAAAVGGEADSDVHVIAGGVTRLDSVRNALAALLADAGCRADAGPHGDAVLVHDVARPFVPAAVIERVVAALAAGADAVVPGIAVIDTIKEVDAGEVVVATLDRTRLRAIQTPQGFRLAALIAAHEGAPEATDDAGLIESRGGTVVVVEGADESFKITRPWDLLVAEAVVRS